MFKKLFNFIIFKRKFPMLKKLVKYGNSNALIFDKAILELLNIEENSVVKIKTDGKSLIITPHVKNSDSQEKVSETYTSDTAASDFMVNSYINRYEAIDESKREAAAKEIKELLAQEIQLNKKLFKNPELIEELKKLPQTTSFYDHKKAYDDIKAKYSPEQAEWSKKFKEWETKNNLVLKEQFKTMRFANKDQIQALQEIGKKFNIPTELEAISNSPEYQHEVQLIAEKYKNDQNSTEYINSMKELTYKYLPGLRVIDEEFEKALRNQK